MLGSSVKFRHRNRGSGSEAVTVLFNNRFLKAMKWGSGMLNKDSGSVRTTIAGGRPCRWQLRDRPGDFITPGLASSVVELRAWEKYSH